MKRLFTILALVSMAAGIFGQSPEKMSYQAVVRNSSNQLVTSQKVGMKISILQATVTGTAVYVETQTPTTNANGLVSVEIGGGTVISGTFSSINWVNGPYFIKTETDPAGGTNYSITGTIQLLSVPYALYAGEAGNGFASVFTEDENRPVIDTVGNITIGASSNRNDLWAKLNVIGYENILPYQNDWGSMLGLDARPVGGKYYLIASMGNRDDDRDLGKFIIRSADFNSVLVMDKNGLLGIGNNYPAFKLDVSGDINFTGKLFRDGNEYGGNYNTLVNKPIGNNIGDMRYWNGTSWAIIPAGTNGQILTMKNGIPTWE